MNSAFSLEGKVANVKGVGGKAKGIGETFAVGLAEAGAAVVCANRTLAGASRVADTIRTRGGEALSVQVDVSDVDAVREMGRAAIAEFGGVDILVKDAALMDEIKFQQSITEVPIEDWDRAFAVNTTGALLCAREVEPSMKTREGGKIVNQISGCLSGDQSLRHN